MLGVAGDARIWIRICVRVAGCSSWKCDLATTHRSRSSRTRDVFPGTSVARHCFRWNEPVCEFGEEEEEGWLAIRVDFWGF